MQRQTRCTADLTLACRGLRVRWWPVLVIGRWVLARGARLARRDDRQYREYGRESQRRQAGCSAPLMQAAFHYGQKRASRGG